MFLEIKPTTTLAQLSANNTSAADSFAGWLPGMERAGNVSHLPLNVPQKAFAHRCDWWDTGTGRSTSHHDIGIKSTDPAYCERTADAMQAQGLAGAFLDWYGPGSREDKALLVLKPALEKRGMQFALCVDGGTKAIKSATTDALRTSALLTVLAYARNTYFASPAYLRHDSKPVILFFGFATADFDWPTIRRAYADCKLIFRWERNPQYSDRPYADGYFGWTDDSEEWIANVKARAPGKLIIFGLNGRFNNTDPALCPWGVGHNKVIDAHGGMTFQTQLAIARKHPEIEYLSVNTWNDYEEKSALEPGIPSGQSIALEMSAGVLNWNSAGLAFDHYDLLVSRDGTNFMRLTRSSEPMLVDLEGLEFAPGSYWFVVQAIGLPMVQAVVSNVVAANLSWGGAQ